MGLPTKIPDEPYYMIDLLKSIALSIPAVKRVKDERDQAVAELEAAREQITRLRSGLASAPGSNDLKGQLAELLDRIGSIMATFGEQRAPETTAPPYDLLPGTPYSRYAVPIEYFPSRDFRVRTPQPPLHALLASTDWAFPTARETAHGPHGGSEEADGVAAAVREAPRERPDGGRVLQTGGDRGRTLEVLAAAG